MTPTGTIGESFSITRDDHDWLLELGRSQGESRLVTSQHPVVQGLIDEFRAPAKQGLALPWWQADEYVRFMPGKVSVWSGPSFSGKTSFLRQLMLHSIARHVPVMFVSLEEQPDAVWREFICTACGTRTPTRAQVKWCIDAWDGYLLVFDSTEMPEPLPLLGLIRWCAERHGVKQAVIDSLMRLNMRIDDYDGQREMGNLLGRAARLAQTHIHLVAHPRKTANSRASMDMYDIRGAQDIVAQADLVLTLERQHGDAAVECDSKLTVWKQRGDIDWIGTIKLFYDKPSRQLLFSRSESAVRYVPENI